MQNSDIKLKGPIMLPVHLTGGDVKNFEFYFRRFKNKRYIILKNGKIHQDRWTVLRIDSACLFGHVFGSRRCDCEFQLRRSIDIIGKRGGLLIYSIDDDGRGLGIEGHFDTYFLRQIKHLETEELYIKLKKRIDTRRYNHVVYFLKQFNIKKIKLLTNNPQRINILKTSSFQVKRIPLETVIDQYNAPALMDKKDNLHYLFSFNTHTEYLRDLLQNKKRKKGDLGLLLIGDFRNIIYRGFVHQSIAQRGIWKRLLKRLRALKYSYLTLYLTDIPRDQYIPSLASLHPNLIVLPKNSSRHVHKTRFKEIKIPLETVKIT